MKVNFDKLKSLEYTEKKRRKIRIAFDVEIGETESDEHAKFLLLNTLMVDCWVGEFTAAEILSVEIMED